MENELFNIALQHCDIIKTDLNAQNEKLKGVKNKILQYSEALQFNEKYLIKLKKTTSIRKTYFFVFLIFFIFGTTFSILKFSKI
ncbi:hypothetical protein EBI_26395 [Enterocytozoon bieneusi H348]|nr:hypothetical protein EBI_26395 [Enterocytozoon bieneusi H348]|eukprot:XP_001827867.1 hypothetical protein EBI_26395 [Enterocytozoon bieneusi H348]